MHAHDAHAYHDVTRLTYDVNHITLTSPVFVFHLCHVGMIWRDIVGVHVVGTLCHHGSHHTGMTSSCSHHIHVVLMTSSHSDCDIIVTWMIHDFSHGT